MNATIRKIRRLIQYATIADIVRFCFGLHAINENSYCYFCDALIVPVELCDNCTSSKGDNEQ